MSAPPPPPPPPLLRPPRHHTPKPSKSPKLRLPNLNISSMSTPNLTTSAINEVNNLQTGQRTENVPKPVPVPSIFQQPASKKQQPPRIHIDTYSNTARQQQYTQQSRDNSLETINSNLQSLHLNTSASSANSGNSPSTATSEVSLASAGVFSPEIIAEVEKTHSYSLVYETEPTNSNIMNETNYTSITASSTAAPTSISTLASTSITTTATALCELRHTKLTIPPHRDLSTLTEEEWRTLSLSNSIIPLTHLGEGTSGTVTKARLTNHTQIFALKQIIASDTETSKQLLRELKFNKEFHSEFIVRYYGMFLNEETASVYIAMEFMSGGSLDSIYKHAISLNRLIGERIIGKIAEAVLQGLKYLNSKGVIHRDIKPQNILIDGYGHVKLCDFGVSGILENSFATTFTGTSFYMAPERIQGGSYSITSDIWSLGLTLLEVGTGSFPLDLSIESSPIDILTEIIDFEPDLSNVRAKGFSESYVSFIEFCLRKNSKERASARQLLEHPWIKGQRKKSVDMKAWIEACWSS